MATLDNDDKRMLTEAFKDAMSGANNSFGARPAARSDTSNAGGGADATRMFGYAVKEAGESAKSGIGKLAGELDRSVSGFQKLSDTGASFNNNAIGMRDSISNTRLSMEEYGQVIKNLNPSIAGLGGTVDAGTKNFNKFSGEFMKTDFADQLTKMGYTTKDLNDVMAANMANRRFTDLSDDAARKKAIEATAQLAREMDETSKLTGISRQEQMADMKQRSENGKVQAAIQLEVIRGGKDVEQQYNNMQQGLNGLGKGVKDLADEMFTGGVRTEEGAAKMAALGPAGTELQKAITASKNAKTDEEKAAAAAQLERAKMAVNERMKSEEFLQAVMTAGGKVGPAMQKMYEENKLRAGTTATETKTGASTKEAMVANERAAMNQQQGKDEKGVKDEGAKTTELYIQGINRTKDIMAGAATGVNEFNKAFAQSPFVKEGLKLTAPSRVVTDEEGNKKRVSFSDEGIKGFADRLASFKAEGDTTGGKATAPIGAQGKPLEGSRVYPREAPGAPVSAAGSALGAGVNKVLGAAMTAIDPGYVKVLEVLAGGPLATRDEGTIGKTGLLKEPKDFFGKIAKDETVFTENQMANFAKGAKSTGVSEMFEGFKTTISSIASPSGGEGRIKASSADMVREASKRLSEASATQNVKSEPKAASADQPAAMPNLSEATLSDVVKSLEMLNTQMTLLVSHSAESAENTGAAVKATKGLNGNLFAR